MSNSSNQQNKENQQVPDIVLDSRLPTQFLHGTTQHTVPHQSRHGRPSRIKETWSRQLELGSGSFGCVWLERCVSGPGEGKLRAVKEIRKDPSLPVIYNRELEAMVKFSQKKYIGCFVECYGWYESERMFFIAMEYFEHGDLQNYLDQPFSEAHAKEITSQLVEGLGYMHENGFAHRDLKPKNILVSQPGPDWWVKIGDLGISKRAEGTALRTAIGTEGYFAPEVLGFVLDQSSPLRSNALSYTFAVDMWALGVLLFRMIAQHHVFPNRSDLFNHIVNNIPFPIQTLEAAGASHDCCSFIIECMAIDPKCRLKASEAAVHPWMQTSQSPSRSSGRISPTRLREVPQPMPTKVPMLPAIPSPPLVANFEDTAPWSTSSQSLQQVQDKSSATGSVSPIHNDLRRLQIMAHRLPVARNRAEYVTREPRDLLWASSNGQVETVKALLEKGANVMLTAEDGSTPLHLASKNGYIEVIKALLEKGAKVEVADKDGWTALHMASRNGHAEVIKALLEKGARTMLAAYDGWTPLDLASSSGHIEAVKVLLEEGADPKVADKDGWTPLHLASQNGHIKVVKILLEKGANAFVLTDKGSTPLDLALSNEHLKVAKALLIKGTNLDVNDNLAAKRALFRENEAVAMFKFDAVQPGDLGFKKGEVITILRRTESDNDWWTGQIGTRTGIFPSNYIKLKE